MVDIVRARYLLRAVRMEVKVRFYLKSLGFYRYDPSVFPPVLIAVESDHLCAKYRPFYI